MQSDKQLIRIGLSIEDGIVTVLGDEGYTFEVHVFDKDLYDEADDQERMSMEDERAIVEAMPHVIAEL